MGLDLGLELGLDLTGSGPPKKQIIYNLSHGEEEKTVAKKAKLEAELAKLK